MSNLTEHTKDQLAKDRDKILAILDKMVARIKKEDPYEAQHAESYWAGSVRGALGSAYGGLDHLIK